MQLCLPSISLNNSKKSKPGSTEKKNSLNSCIFGYFASASEKKLQNKNWNIGVFEKNYEKNSSLS
jgi:hypothetical protein